VQSEIKEEIGRDGLEALDLLVNKLGKERWRWPYSS
jgi:hypothetical protein